MPKHDTAASATGRHVHDWKPIAGEAGRYTCACGAGGWRHLRSGQIRIAVKPRKAEPLTAGYSQARSSRDLPVELEPNTRDPDR